MAIATTPLSSLVRHAYDAAPAVRRLLDDAGVAPEAIRDPSDLERLPVTKKETLLEQQRTDPPFGGYCGVSAERLRRIYISPGPLYDLQGEGDEGLGFKRVFEVAGVGPGDIALNTWSYHLVPAGLAFDEALTAVGATVIPGGVGNAELQAQAIVELGVTVVVASTSFFVTLAETLEEAGHELPRDWKVRLAFLGGEPGDWYGRRRMLEERYSLETISAYGTGDLGMVAWECGREPGYHVLAERIVQICDPETGVLLPDGEVGEIVVTSLNETYPLIRFGTGDAASLLPACPCGHQGPRLSPIAGRVGDSVKVREIFVYPRNLEQLAARIPAVTTARAVVTREGHRDHLLLRVRVSDGTDEAALAESVREAFTAICRLRPDTLEFVRDDLSGEPAVSDRRRL